MVAPGTLGIRAVCPACPAPATGPRRAMDDRSFDHLTRTLGLTPSRRVAVGAVAAAVAALVIAGRRDESEARRKRKTKKRKKRAQQGCTPRCAGKDDGAPDGCGGLCTGASTCRQLRETCSSAAGNACCGALTCSDNGCVGDPVCLQDDGGPCTDRCDCRLGLECSDRFGNTCRSCALLQNGCISHDECCLASAACGSNIYGPGVCCQQRGFACGLDSDCCANTGRCGLNGCGGVERVCCYGQGFQCASNCDCCDPLRCLNGTCQ
jgi:hypothetical protein